MAANIGGGGGGGGGPPSFTAGDYNPPMERQLIFQYNNNNSNKAGISIAERRAATCGFNASNINVTRLKATAIADPVVPCFTIPPGISPSTLLDSPIMLPNAQAAQPSPTTGTFEFPSPKHDSLNPKLDHAAIASKHEPPEDVAHSAPADNIPFEGFEYLQETSNIKDCFEDVTLVTKTDHEVSGNKSKELPQCFSLQPPTNSNHTNQILSHCHHGAAKRQISTHPNQEKHRKSSTAHFRKEVDNYCDDGFYWRKYGQKHVKGSEYPRSYYRCTNMNCPVKKKVERSHDGQITEIVYWGSHNHPAPRPLKRLTENSEMTSTEGSPSCFITHDGNDFASSSDWKPTDCLDGTASTSFMTCISCEPHVEAQFSSAFGSQDGDGRNEASPESISLNNEDDENGESSELRKRKRESIPIETTALRSTREPRVVIQIESKNDILDDGYRWRKYGQKVVKGNPNPRSYYKCTTPGCLVRKHITRAADDIRSVVTTYEGKHNHELPASKNAGLVTNVPPAVTNNTVSTPSTMARKLDVQNIGKQVQDLPLYLDRKPLFSYNELMRSNLPGSFASDMNFGASSVYPLSFPPFQSLPPYGSLLMNNNHLNNYPSSNLYPMFSDYMSLPSQINHVHGSVNASPLGGNFHFNNYAGFQTEQKTEIRERHADILKPKEEQRDDSELYIYDT